MSDPSEPQEPFPDIEPIETSLPPIRPTYVPKPTPGPLKPSPLPAIAFGLLLGALTVGGGILLGQSLPKQEAPAAPAPGASTAPAPGPDVKPAADAAPALAGRVDGLGTEVQALAKRLDDVQKGLAALPKPEPAPDVAPIEAKLDALAKRLDAASPPDLKGLEDKVAKASALQVDEMAKLDALAARAAGLEKALAAQKAEIVAVQDRLKSSPEARPSQDAPAGAGAGAAAPPAAEADYARAIDLFRKNQFAPARDAFVKLGESSPNDARVWYFAAVANGYATNVWNGETERLVTRGVELEKAGTPDVAKINAAFADLGPPSVKGWLDAYRARAR